jgi:hypothetical protein
MNRLILRTSVAAIGGLLALGIGGAAYAAGPSASPGRNSTPAATASAATVSDAVKTALTFSRDEERMARDLYAKIAAKYDGASPFANITRSEQRHFDAVGVLLTRYSIADPASGQEAGVYADAAVQSLYDGWLARANTSLDEAYQVGVELETRDIEDLNHALALDAPADVDRVLSNLLAGSKMHLAAFTNAANGTPHEPVGPGAGQGAGQGMGAGQGEGKGQGRGAGQGMGAGQGRGPGDGTGTCVNG